MKGKNKNKKKGAKYFNQKELNKIKCNDIIQNVKEKFNIDWNDFPDSYKYGTFIKKSHYHKEGKNLFKKKIYMERV
jgi:hypothetical protein